MKQERLIFSFAVLFCIYGMICARLYYLQVWERERLSERARRQWLRVSHEKPLKSTIYDRKGRILAFSSFADSFFVNPKRLDNPQKAVPILSKMLDLDEGKLADEIRHSKGYFMWLKRMVDPVQSDKLKKCRLQGIGWIKERKRFYSENGLASTLLGLVGIDDQPLSGIELVASKMLAGERIKSVCGRDAKGRMIDLDGTASVDFPTGHVYLTIDKTIQYIAEKELNSAFEKYNAKWGCAIVQNVKTGEILAMAVCPQFSNSSPFCIKKLSQLHNLSIGQVFEPGSTLKIVPLAAAIEENVCALDDLFDCHNGKYNIASLVIHDHIPRDMLTFRQVFEHSSNIGAAQVGQKLGKEKLYYYARAFGFGNRTGIMLPGESNGILRKPRYWSGVSLPMISFGQEIGVTGIQLASAYSAVANGGVLLEPQIIGRVLNEDKKVVWESSPKKIRRVISRETSRFVISVLEGVTERGTGCEARVDGYSVAGKTGTAQKFDSELNRYSDDAHVASFCGFLPAGDPQISIVVILDEPQGVYWGGVVAAPVFSRIAKQAVSCLNISPDKIDFASVDIKTRSAIKQEPVEEVGSAVSSGNL